jgi:hypothetical protein
MVWIAKWPHNADRKEENIRHTDAEGRQFEQMLTSTMSGEEMIEASMATTYWSGKDEEVRN